MNIACNHAVIGWHPCLSILSLTIAYPSRRLCSKSTSTFYLDCILSGGHVCHQYWQEPKLSEQYLDMEPPRKRQKLHENIATGHAEPIVQASRSGHQQHHESRQSYSTGVQNQNGSITTGGDLIINNVTKTNDPIDHRQSLLESLRFDQIDARQSTIKKAYSSTCKWFLKNPSYKEWERKDPSQDDNHFLWIKGKPGAGKSTLMKYLHQQILKRGDGITISFFFNARGEDLEKSTIGLYRSLLLQLLEKRPDLQHVLDTSRPSREWNVESLKTLFEEALQDLGQTPLTCVIDALDECEEQDVRDMVRFLNGLVCTGNRLYICFASRHYPHITLETGLHIILEEQDKHQDDIITYLEGSLRIGHQPDSQKIRSEIQEKASGVFMWVVLVVDILNKESDAGRRFALGERLRQLPSNLHELFRDILTRDTNHQEALLLCIQWVLLAKRPLTPKELYFAILSGYEPQHLSHCHSNETTDEEVYKYILNNSKGLVESTKSKHSTIQFIHESVRDFLLKSGGLGEIFPSIKSNVHGQGHEALKSCCMTYINVVVWSDNRESSRKDIQQRLPFLEYAVHGVLHHSENAEDQGISQLSFINNFPRRTWIKRYNELEKRKSRQYTPHASLLYILAEFNLAALIHVHQSHQYFDIEDERYGLPILAATATKSVAAVRMMLKIEGEKSATFPWAYFQDLVPLDPDAFFSISSRDFNFNKRREKMPQLLRHGSQGLLLFLLLAGGCRFDSKDDQGIRLLESTVVRGFTILFRELVRKNPQAIPNNAIATNLLFRAVRYPEPRIPEQLIELGADVTSVDRKGRTPLHNALYVAVAQLLIKRGADPSSTDQSGMTPLHHAVDGKLTQIVKLLIASGANLSITDDTGKTPLASACRNASNTDPKMVNLAILLAQRRVGLSIADEDGRTPLHHACAKHGNAALVKSLVGEGSDILAADIQMADPKGATPLHYVCSIYGGIEAARLLLDHGANVSAVDQNRQTALHYASKEWYVDSPSIVELMIQHGAGIGTRDQEGKTPLHLVRRSLSAEILLKNGADVSAVDNDGKTPLHLVRDSSIAEALIKSGADVSIADNDGKTPLFYAQENSRTAVAKLLIDHGGR